MQQAEADARSFYYSHIYLCTDLAGYYEKYNFEFMGMGYDREASRVHGKAVV